MPSSSSSFSPCSIKLIRNCIPSLHLFSTFSSQPKTIPPHRWPVELVEAVCVDAFNLATKEAVPEGVAPKQCKSGTR